MMLICTQTVMKSIWISPCGLKSNTNWLEVQTNGINVWIVYVNVWIKTLSGDVVNKRWQVIQCIATCEKETEI